MNKWILLLLLTPIVTKAQSDLNYDWAATPELHTLDTIYSEAETVFILDRHEVAFYYDIKDDLQAQTTTHRIIKVQTDASIEANNKVYLPYSDDASVIRQQVRVINSQGKVFDLDASDIREATDAETERKYRYFALKGMDIGSEVEYFIVLQSIPNVSGVDFLMQSNIPKVSAVFDLVAPDNLIFDIRSYNGLPEATLDTLEGKLRWHVAVDDLTAIREEPFANAEDNRKRLAYKLYRNTYGSGEELVRYGPVAEDVYSYIFVELSKSGAKNLDKMLKEIPFEKEDDTALRILKTEQYFKKKMAVIEASSDELEDIDFVLNNRVTNERGFTKLLAQAFTKLGIEARIVITCDRFDRRMDPGFEAYNFLDTYLLYFPETDSYLQPAGILYRSPMVYYGYTDNWGLFLDPITLGDFTTAMARIDFIAPATHEQTSDNTFIEVDFSKDITNPLIHMRHEQIGYNAIVQILFDYYDEEDKEELRRQYLDFISKAPENLKIDSKNEGSEYNGIAPYIVDASFNSKEFIDKTANKFLFKIGEMIGAQSEMYFERDRMFPVENDFNRSYLRVIEFDIPEGYICKNLEQLSMDVFMEGNDMRSCTFTSTVTQEENHVKVEITEYYSNIREPLTNYAAFAEVINAAADFNKVVLLFEPAQ